MPAPKGNQFAKGHDGRGTGRKSFLDEKVVYNVINKNWKWLDQNWDKFTNKQKLEIALKLCPRTIPEERMHMGEVKFLIIDKTDGNTNSVSIQSEQREEISNRSMEQSNEIQSSNNP